MILDLVYYGHPALRSKGTPIAAIDARIRKLAEDMIETMYENDGVGLAAHQVGMPVRLFVIDVLEARDRPSEMRIDGKKVPLEKHMPLVLINPTISSSGEDDTGPEGCLSIPGIAADVTRPAEVDVEGTGIDGEQIRLQASGLLARALQHENDHLNDVLFTDHLPDDQKKELLPELNALAARSRQSLL